MKNSKFKIQNSKFWKLWIWVGIMLLLSPLGLILPRLLKSGGAWGEWGADELKGVAGYVPEGIKRFSKLWSAPFADYSLPGWRGGTRLYLSYVISGIGGVIIVWLVAHVFTRIFKRGEGGRTRKT